MLLVGQGEEEEHIREIVIRQGLDNRVIFAGVRNDIDRLMQGMDVFVLPSLFEGLPVTMIEAQAAGLPCVISDKITKECILTKNVKLCGIEEDSQMWAEIIESFSDCKRESTYRLISEAGYDIEKNAKYLQDFYIGEYSTVERS